MKMFQCVLVSIGVTVPRWFSKEISILEALPKASQVVLSLKCRWKAYGEESIWGHTQNQGESIWGHTQNQVELGKPVSLGRILLYVCPQVGQVGVRFHRNQSSVA